MIAAGVESSRQQVLSLLAVVGACVGGLSVAVACGGERVGALAVGCWWACWLCLGGGGGDGACAGSGGGCGGGCGGELVGGFVGWDAGAAVGDDSGGFCGDRSSAGVVVVECVVGVAVAFSGRGGVPGGCLDAFLA
jgi:hypothetical protein